MASSATDLALLERVAAGDESAMRELYERYQGSVLAFATSRLRDPVQAGDVLHDVMLDVWRRPEAFTGRSAFRTWLLTLARNKSIDRMRRSSRLDYGDDGGELLDETPLPDAALEASQDKARVRACIDALPDAQRAAVRLTFFDGLTVREAAEVEDIPAGTIKTRIFHAKKALLACLGG